MSTQNLAAGASIVSLTPDQINALHELVSMDGAIALDVSADTMMRVLVSVYFSADRTDEDAPLTARWFSISPSGSVQEIAPDADHQVAA